MIFKFTLFLSILYLSNSFEIHGRWCLRHKDCKTKENCEGVTQECPTCRPIPGICEPRHPRICQSGKRCKAEEKCMLFTDMNEELCVPKDYCRPFINTKDDCEEGYYCSNSIGKCVPNEI